MSASNSFENSFLLHLLQNANIANIGDATGLRGSTTVGNLYLSLHTSDPGEAGDQSTNEIAYTGYTRLAVVRDASNWTVAANVGSNTNTISFGACTAGSGTATHFGLGTASSGAGVLLISGTVTPNLAISAGITPQFAASALNITLD
jgi:hypothetical protein